MANVAQLRAAAVPLLLVAVAAALWWLSDRAGQIGPLDKATFGWLFAVPIWAVSPAAAGFAWRGFAPRGRVRASIANGGIVGTVVGFLLWLSVVTTDCQLGLNRTTLELTLPAIVCGMTTGAVFAFGLYEASAQLAAGHTLRSIAVGAAAQLALLLIVPTIAFLGFFGGVCARP
jgi:hypothetical protein